MWFNCFNSSRQLNDRIFLSRRSITHRLDTNLSLYNSPSLFLYSSMDVIHSGQNSFSLFMNFYLVLFLLSLSSLLQPQFQCHCLCAQCVRERADHPTEDIFTCVHAHSARLARVCVAGLELGRERPGGQDRSHSVHSAQARGTITRYHPYPSIIDRACIKLNTDLPENNL